MFGPVEVLLMVFASGPVAGLAQATVAAVGRRRS
jgi:hypothetical protein